MRVQRVLMPVQVDPVVYTADPALLARVADGLRALDDWMVPSSSSPAWGGVPP